MIFAIAGLVISSSLLSIYSKKVLNGGIPPTLLLYISATIGGLLFLPLAVLSPLPPSNTVFTLILAAILRFFAALLLNYSIKLTEVSFIAPFSSFHSVFGILFGILFLSEYPTFSAIIGILLIIISSFFLYRFDVKERHVNAKAIILKLVGIALIVLSAVILRSVLLGIGFAISVAYMWIILGVMSLPFLIHIYFRNPAVVNIVKESKSNLIVLIIFALSVSLLEIFLFSKIQVGYVFAYTQVGLLMTVILADKLLGEKRAFKRIPTIILSIVGAAFIFFGSK